MARIQPLTVSEAPDRSRPQLEGVQKGLGMVPNMIATIAHSPPALQAYLGFGQALGGSELSGALREKIALAVAGANGCDYCASAHSVLGRAAGIADDELERNIRGESDDDRANAALDFARAVVSRRGHVGDDELARVRDAGFSDAAIVDIVATVAINIFTNYFNHVAETEIDFPVVELPAAVAAT